MFRFAYVNGRYVSYAAAQVHVEDRGFQFSDGVYEVFAVVHGALIDEELHLSRLARSLSELRISKPHSDAVFKHLFREVLRRNRNQLTLLKVTPPRVRLAETAATAA